MKNKMFFILGLGLLWLSPTLVMAQEEMKKWEKALRIYTQTDTIEFGYEQVYTQRKYPSIIDPKRFYFTMTYTKEELTSLKLNIGYMVFDYKERGRIVGSSRVNIFKASLYRTYIREFIVKPFFGYGFSYYRHNYGNFRAKIPRYYRLERSSDENILGYHLMGGARCVIGPVAGSIIIYREWIDVFKIRHLQVKLSNLSYAINIALKF